MVPDSGAPPGGAEQSIEIPRSIFVRCPLAQYRLRQVAESCPGCAHFKGLADRYPGSPVPFQARFLALCTAEPVKRELFEIEQGGASQ